MHPLDKQIGPISITHVATFTRSDKHECVSI